MNSLITRSVPTYPVRRSATAKVTITANERNPITDFSFMSFLSFKYFFDPHLPYTMFLDQII